MLLPKRIFPNIQTPFHCVYVFKYFSVYFRFLANSIILIQFSRYFYLFCTLNKYQICSTLGKMELFWDSCGVYLIFYLFLILCQNTQKKNLFLQLKKSQQSIPANNTKSLSALNQGMCSLNSPIMDFLIQSYECHIY